MPPTPDRRALLTGLALAASASAASAAAQPASATRGAMEGHGGGPDGPLRFARAINALKSDPRFSWGVYVPPSFAGDPAGHELAVIVHGSGRDQWPCRERFEAFARFNRFVILAPMFPVGVLGDDNADGYKYMAGGAIRYDRVLLDMVDEVGRALGRRFPKFMLHGFSGGGHFAHRFFYLQPERLSAVSIGSPGGITLLDDTKDFWIGTRDFQKRFGRPIDLAALRRVPVQLVVGANDVEEFTYPAALGAFNAEQASLGKNRIERNATLLRNYKARGLNVRQVIVPNCAHDGEKVVADVQDFFLASRRSA